MNRLLLILLFFTVFSLVVHAIWLHRDDQRTKSVFVAVVAAGLVIAGLLMIL